MLEVTKATEQVSRKLISTLLPEQGSFAQVVSLTMTKWKRLIYLASLRPLCEVPNSYKWIQNLLNSSVRSLGAFLLYCNLFNDEAFWQLWMAQLRSSYVNTYIAVTASVGWSYADVWNLHGWLKFLLHRSRILSRFMRSFLQGMMLLLFHQKILSTPWWFTYGTQRSLSVWVFNTAWAYGRDTLLG